jgi:hypothetical protein
MSGVISIKKGEEGNDNHKILELIFETASDLVPKIVDNVTKTLNKSSFTIKCTAEYNKDDELVIKVSGACSLPTETVERKGEVLEGKLKLW